MRKVASFSTNHELLDGELRMSVLNYGIYKWCIYKLEVSGSRKVEHMYMKARKEIQPITAK